MVKALFRILAALLLMALVIWLVGPARLLAAFANADPFWLGAGLCAALTASTRLRRTRVEPLTPRSQM